MIVRDFYKKHKSIISYVFFGVLTTVINIAAYTFFYETEILSNVPATIAAWVIATVFAFVTNKLFVFESRRLDAKTLLSQLGSFYFFRIATGIVDVLIMWVSVDILRLDATLFKIISNVIVIVLNYIASKLVIFRK